MTKLNLLRLERKILSLLRRGKGESALKHFKPSIFFDFFNRNFTFQDYVMYAKGFTRKEIDARMLIVKKEIKEEEEKLIKNELPLEKEEKKPWKRYETYIPPLKKDDNKTGLWGVMDIETRGINNAQVPYAWGYKIEDTLKWKLVKKDPYNEIMETLIEIAQYTKAAKAKCIVLYLHNFAKFDSYFLLKALLVKVPGDDLNILKTKRGFLTIAFKINGINIKFLDSFLILNHSLDDLAVSFKIGGRKTLFPYEFVENNLNYIGPKPDIKFYSNITPGEYEKIPMVFNLKNEIRKYLKNDIIILFKIVKIFKEKIYNNYKINILNILTLPQLAFIIFRKFHLKENQIPIIKGENDYIIRNAYYGGASEVFRPQHEKIWFYDVNSMYPWAMCKSLPTGLPTRYFFEDILFENFDMDFFGFLYCEISIEKKSTYAPVLPRRVKKKLIFGTGKWTGWYFSEEIKFAQSTGLYKIIVKSGLKFNKEENVLTSYVEHFYNIKKTTKDPVEKGIAKLLLNSLYGRFGMKRITSSTTISNDPMFDWKNVKDFTELGEFGILYELWEKEKKFIFSNTAIAAAITSYARIKSFKLIRENEKIIAYHDTDSFALTAPIKASELGNNLGQLKNIAGDKKYTIKKDKDYFVTDALFVSPKVYKYKMNDESIVKMKGIKKNAQTGETVEELFNKLEVTRTVLQFKRNIEKLDIKIENINKTFTIKREDKRIKVEIGGVWCDTLPIHTNENDPIGKSYGTEE